MKAFTINCLCVVVVFSDMLRVTQEKVLMKQQQEEEERRAELNRDLIQYRAIRQRAEDTRDADLNVHLQGALGLSIPIPESELGPASMQVFQVSQMTL